MAKLSKEVMEAISTLWAESLRLNCGAAYEGTHQVLKDLEKAAEAQEETNDG